MRQMFGVFGTGYQGRTADTLVTDLHASGVDTVVDIRLTPISRKPGLSKTALKQHLNAVGIEYLHLRALGNPKTNRAGFAGTHDELAKSVQQYRQLLETEDARQALAEIRDRAARQRIVLLCFENDEQRCHRHVVLEALTTATV